MHGVRWGAVIAVGAAVVLGACGGPRGSASPAHAENPPPPAWDQSPTPASEAPPLARDEGGAAPDAPALREVFEHVRADAASRVVEFDGIVPIDCHHEDTPDVYLEVIACTKGSREHEALVMTEARPSHVHAALLLIGLEPGAPGAPAGRGGAAVEPTGDAVRVQIVYTDEAGREIGADADAWIRHVETGAVFATKGWVFSGSRIVTHRGREVYDADGTGLLIGLALFGNARVEAPSTGGAAVALRDGFSPEAGVAEPVWIANAERVPAFGTRVIVRLSAAE